VPPDLNNKLIFLAEREGISKNALMLRVLELWVSQSDKKKLMSSEKNKSRT